MWLDAGLDEIVVPRRSMRCKSFKEIDWWSKATGLESQTEMVGSSKFTAIMVSHHIWSSGPMGTVSWFFLVRTRRSTMFQTSASEIEPSDSGPN